MQKTLTLALLLLSCSCAQDDQWVSIGRTADGTQEQFVDVSRIRLLGDYALRKAWYRVVYAPNTLKNTATNRFVHEKWTYVELNCIDRTFLGSIQDPNDHYLFVVFDYGGADKPPPDYYVHETPKPIPPVSFDIWKPVPPYLKDLVHFVCAWAPK
jgi:hypothetical protein